jgi:hypothetical protein
MEKGALEMSLETDPFIVYYSAYPSVFILRPLFQLAYVPRIRWFRETSKTRR